MRRKGFFLIIGRSNKPINQMIRNVILGIICLFPIFSQAQNIKNQGQVFLNSGDTLSGEILYYSDQPGKLKVVKAENIRSIAITDVSSLRLSDHRKFVSAKVEREDVKVAVLLEAIVEAPKMSLYKYEYLGMRYYVKKEGAYYLLENNEVVVYQDDKSGNNKVDYKKYDLKYIGVLNYLMSDDPSMRKQVNKTGFNERELMELILQYNQGNVSYMISTPGDAPKEPNYTLYAFGGVYRTFLNREAYTPSYTYGAGLQWYFRRTGRWSMLSGIHYSNYNLHEKTYRGDVLEYSQQMISVHVKLQYEFIQKEKFSVYGGIHGIDLTLISYEGEYQPVGPSEFLLLPRLSPYAGVNVRWSPRWWTSVQVNHLLRTSYIGRNLSVGITYDIGPTTL